MGWASREGPWMRVRSSRALWQVTTEVVMGTTRQQRRKNRARGARVMPRASSPASPMNPTRAVAFTSGLGWHVIVVGTLSPSFCLDYKRKHVYVWGRLAACADQRATGVTSRPCDGRAVQAQCPMTPFSNGAAQRAASCASSHPAPEAAGPLAQA